MKKLFSVLLALVMVFSLTAPALAAAPEKDLDPPLWHILGYDSYEDLVNNEFGVWTEESYAEELSSILTFMENNPDLTAQFQANAYSYYEETYTYLYDTPEEYMAEWGETEAQFITDMTVVQIRAYQYVEQCKTDWAAVCAEQPERTALFLSELPAWFAAEYPWYGSFEEYCEYYDCVEEAYLSLFEEWNWNYAWEQELAQQKAEFITAHGGVPGQLNVMVNGKYVQFTDAVPELTAGRTMVPFRAIFEALGAEVGFENGTVRAELGDTVLELVPGSDTLTRTAGGKTSTVKMDCAPYLKNERTYVPVRFVSEALGYDVQWDDYYQSAVITDLDALAELIDQNFTIYNKLAARSALTAKAQKSTGSGQADVTLFDTLNGDKTGQATFSYDLAASTVGASGKLEYDLSELWALIEGYIPVPLDESYDPDYTQEYTQTLELVKALMKGSMEVRVDLEKGKAYLSMPSLFEAMNSFAESGTQLPTDAWLSAGLSDGAAPDLTALMSQTLTIGKLLTSQSGVSSYPAKSYEDTLEAAKQFGKLYGDAKFTRQGDADVLTITKEDLADLLDVDTGAASLDALTKYEVTMTVKDNGDVDMSCQARVALSGSGINLGDFVDVSATGTTRDGKTESTMEVHIKNVLKATVTLEETVTETDQAPEVTPPSDVLVIPTDGSLGSIPGGAITSPDGPTPAPRHTP